MPLDRDPRNIARYARDHMVIGEDVNRPFIAPKKQKAEKEDRVVDRALCWTSYYAMVFAALATFMPYETAHAMEMTAGIADSIGGMLGLTDGWGVRIRGTLD